MQKRILIPVAAVSLSLIVLMGSAKVNPSKQAPVWKNQGEVADGIPMPVPPPKKPGFSVLADGIPMPTPPPKKPGFSISIVADGIPMPVPPPKKTNGVWRG